MCSDNKEENFLVSLIFLYWKSSEIRKRKESEKKAFPGLFESRFRAKRFFFCFHWIVNVCGVEKTWHFFACKLMIFVAPLFVVIVFPFLIDSFYEIWDYYWDIERKTAVNEYIFRVDLIQYGDCIIFFDFLCLTIQDRYINYWWLVT